MPPVTHSADETGVSREADEASEAPRGQMVSLLDLRPSAPSADERLFASPQTAEAAGARTRQPDFKNASETGEAGFVEPASLPLRAASGAATSPSLECNVTLPASHTEYAIAEANRRLGLLQAHAALVQSGCSKAAARRQVGVSEATLWRWQQDYEAQGFEGLIPATHKRGRKSTVAKLGLPQEVYDEVRGMILDTDARVTSGARLFAQSDRCPEALARVILDPNKCSKHALPPSLRKVLKLDANLQHAHRGPRRLALSGMYMPRRLDILPGDIFSSDDTTPIWGWWVPWEKSPEYPFGVKLMQGQFLPVIDVASQCCITFVVIAREKSSYRAADIWHLFGHTFDHIGLPRLGWQLERGSWEADLIRGEEIEYKEGETTHSRRVGGLRQIPTTWTDWHREKHGEHFAFPKTLQTWTSFLPKSKSVEAFLHRSQTFEGTLWGALGRDQMRNPYEKAKKQFQVCQRGKADPRDHFLSHLDIVNKLRALLEYLNNEPMEGEVFRGIPRQTFDRAIAERPLTRLSDDQAYLFRREWKVLTVTQGWARVRLTDPMTSERYSLFYCHPAEFARLEGQEVVVYYDRENFEAPAQIHLAKTGAFLCLAEYFERKGSFLDGDKTGHDLRKKWHSAVMASYGTLAPHAPSRQRPAEIEARRAASAARTPVGPVPTPGVPASPTEARGAATTLVERLDDTTATTRHTHCEVIDDRAPIDTAPTRHIEIIEDL